MESGLRNADWISGKMKSAIAEFACREHLTGIGYTVEPLGVEHVAPAYLALHHMHTKDIPAYCREELHTLPDFIASRRTADGIEVLFIEVKYRSRVDLAKLENLLYTRHGRMIERGAAVVFYLVTREPFAGTALVPGHVFVNRSWSRGWVSPELAMSDEKFIAAGVDAGSVTFDGLYTGAIAPALMQIWGPSSELVQIEA